MAIGTGLAILGSSLIGAAASSRGAKKANQAAQDNAARSQENINQANWAIDQSLDPAFNNWQMGADVAGDYLTQGYNDVYGQYQPLANEYYSGRGMAYAAQNPDVNPYGVVGRYNVDPNTAQAFDPSGFKESPGYQHILKEGLNAVQNSAAAQGGLYSGNTLRDITDYAGGVAAQDYGNWYNRELAAQGFNNAAAANNFGQGMAQQGFNNQAGMWEYGQDYGAQRDARDFNYGRGMDFTRIGIGGIGAQADATGGYYGSLADVYGSTYGRMGEAEIRAGENIANNYAHNAGIQAQTPYVSPYGGINQALQGGLQNWMWYQAMQPQGGGGGGGSYGYGNPSTPYGV